ncbi:unnamed protein product [Prunus armeniaca]
MEGLNLGASVLSHPEADVGGVRRSRQVTFDGTRGRFDFRAPRAVRSSLRWSTRGGSTHLGAAH